MTDLELNLIAAIWTAARIGLHRHRVSGEARRQCWVWVHELTVAIYTPSSRSAS